MIFFLIIFQIRILKRSKITKKKFQTKKNTFHTKQALIIEIIKTFNSNINKTNNNNNNNNNNNV
jgi:hypothetical protein